MLVGGLSTGSGLRLDLAVPQRNRICPMVRGVLVPPFSEYHRKATVSTAFSVYEWVLYAPLGLLLLFGCAGVEPIPLPAKSEKKCCQDFSAAAVQGLPCFDADSDLYHQLWADSVWRAGGIQCAILPWRGAAV